MSHVRNDGRFGYKAHFLVDDAHGIILEAESTGSRLSNEIVAARSMLERQQAERGTTPALVAADKSYGTGQFLGWLAERGIEPMIPVLDRTAQTNGKLSRESFSYDPVRDVYVGSAGHDLRRGSRNVGTRTDSYLARRSDCRTCPLKPDCTSGAARKIERHWDEAVRDHVRLLAKTAAYAAAARARRKVEARFAQMKRTIGLERLRLRSPKRCTRAGPSCSHCHQPEKPGQAQRSLASRLSPAAPWRAADRLRSAAPEPPTAHRPAFPSPAARSTTTPGGIMGSAADKAWLDLAPGVTLF